MENSNYERAIFAGGCFWCMVSPFDVLDGIIRVESGYIGGQITDPTYEDVKSQNSGHYEAIMITFDTEKIDYQKLLKVYWMQIDPTDENGQFHDRGPSYRSAIFYITERQKQLAHESRQKLEDMKKFDKPIVTKILPVSKFYPAEEYHQHFYKKNPVEYKEDRKISGRDEFIKKYWNDEFWKLFEE
ncbi:peptide-methionine (S)-S-oxide reductase MsrA [Clostridiaceae bacterium M8S5]|nr:peptide-methionine (S)-S-oxide reductase MsrA [Clostridiaceae bacterium M8S5]